MIDEQTLILRYYDDGLDDDERRRIDEALAHDEVLAARYATLAKELDAYRSTDDTQAPEHLKHQWHDLVKREATLERQRTGASRWRPGFLLGGALAAVLALGVAIGLFLAEPSAVTTTGEVLTADATNPPSLRSDDAFARGLQVYLEERQAELVGLEQRSDEDQATLVLRIVAQNRLFERAAEQQQSPDIARLLRAFEPILLRLAAEDTAPEDAEALRRQLSFELQAVLTKLQQPTSKAAKT